MFLRKLRAACANFLSTALCPFTMILGRQYECLHQNMSPSTRCGQHIVVSPVPTPLLLSHRIFPHRLLAHQAPMLRLLAKSNHLAPLLNSFMIVTSTCAGQVTLALQQLETGCKWPMTRELWGEHASISRNDLRIKNLHYPCIPPPPPPPCPLT